MTKISATSLESFVSCPYKYYLKYLRRSHGTGKLKTIHMLFGIMIHRILEQFHIFVRDTALPELLPDLRKLLFEELVRIFNRNLSQVIHRHPKILLQLRRTSQGIFDTYIRSYFSFFMENELFKRRLAPEQTFELTLGEIAQTLETAQLHPAASKYLMVKVIGKIDLRVFPDIIIDFKTENLVSPTRKLMGSFQTVIYTLLEPKDLTFIYLYLRYPLRTKELALSKDSRLKRFNELIGILELLTGTRAYNKNPKSCGDCIYRQMCHSR